MFVRYSLLPALRGLLFSKMKEKDTSIYRGVNIWQSGVVNCSIIVNNIRIQLGKFTSEIDAAIQYDTFCKNNNIDRRLNFPDPKPENFIPNTRLIRLTQGKFAIVDEEDFERVDSLNWSCKKHRHTYYSDTNINGKVVKLHRFIMEIFDPKIQIDHKNGNGLHCYKSNLRNATQSQNSMNQQPQKNRTSQYKGVWLNKNNSNYVSKIHLNGKRVHIGVFTNEVDAAKAYDEKAKELFGEFARFNFPELYSQDAKNV